MACAKICFVEHILRNADQEHLIERFTGQGYVTVLDMTLLTKEELESILFVKENKVRELIISAVDNSDVKNWLEFHGLQQYEKNFKSCGLTTIGNVKKLEMVSEHLLDLLEMSLPGHCKRFRAAVEQLNWSPDEQEEGKEATEIVHARGRQLMAQVSSDSPEAVGYWVQHGPDARTDFLYVKGFLKRQPEEEEGEGEAEEVMAEEEELEFLVDSASEVVTAKIETIQRLNLGHKAIVDSQGIHTRQKADLYIGIFRLGIQEVTVEVIPDRFESVGSNVLCHFIHLIDSRFHYWYKPDADVKVTQEEEEKSV